ncbi:MAG: TetR/AcrR family transcriptional regulator [Proteobacteria bacterium]|nr:TetR/AcrR family transcriptional regulator [Pseudomonadota bacterium]
MSRKDDILDAAVILFAENGYYATPTSAVAKKAGVAEGLIYHHFKNKAGILAHIFTELSEVYIRETEVLIKKAASGLDALLAAVRFHFEFAESKSTELKVLMRDLPSEFTTSDSKAGKIFSGQMTLIFNQIKTCIERGRKDGSIMDVPVEETAYIIRGVLNGVSRFKIIMPDIRINPNLYTEVEKFCRRSLARQEQISEA